MTIGDNAHRAWVIEATDDQLDEYISRTSGNPQLHNMALAERAKRHFKHLSKPAEPHWSLPWTFWVAGIRARKTSRCSVEPAARQDSATGRTLHPFHRPFRLRVASARPARDEFILSAATSHFVAG